MSSSSIQLQQQQILAQQRQHIAAASSSPDMRPTILTPVNSSAMSGLTNSQAIYMTRPSPTTLHPQSTRQRLVTTQQIFPNTAVSNTTLPSRPSNIGVMNHVRLPAMPTGIVGNSTAGHIAQPPSNAPLPAAQLSTQGRNIVINQPGIRPGVPGSQMTIPLQTLQNLQPGQGIPTGQPGHLLVKTDDGQFQILRVSTQPSATVQQPQHRQTQLASSVPAPQPTVSALIRSHSPAINSQNTLLHQQQRMISVRGPSLDTSHSNAVSRLSTMMPIPRYSSDQNNKQGIGHSAPPILHHPTNNTNVHSNSLINAYPPAPSPLNASPVPPDSSVPSNSSSVAAAAQMTPETARLKCKNFLATLLRLASEQTNSVAVNVRSLIQGLIDGIVEPEAFTVKLQNELNSSPQPCLGPFLKKSLPFLQIALRSGQMLIEGVRAPPTSLEIVLPTSAASVPSLSVQPPPLSTVRSGVQSSTQRVVSTNMISGITTTGVTTSQIQKPMLTSSTSTSINTNLNSKVRLSSNFSEGNNTTSSSNGGGGGGAGDDELNDVAAMGGVNLDEEAQKMQGSGFGNIVGNQVRSCKDEVILKSGPLQEQISQICCDHKLESVGCEPEVLAVISHAVQSKVRSWVEKLSVISEHRMDSVMKLDSSQDLNQYQPTHFHYHSSPYQVTQDVKGQLRFLSDIHKIERRKNDEAERELLLRAAKSRTKSEDPEREKLRAKAKEMQRMEEEQMRHENANTTAMLAIGGSKKSKPLTAGGGGGSMENSFNSPSFATTLTSSSSNTTASSSNDNSSSSQSSSRIKRVNLRDVAFMMEQERSLKRSRRLWSLYANT